jgi:hypothetical protein
MRIEAAEPLPKMSAEIKKAATNAGRENNHISKTFRFSFL